MGIMSRLIRFSQLSSIDVYNITGSLFGTASWAKSSSNSISSSHAITSLETASVNNATITLIKGNGLSFDITVNNVTNAISSSFASTATSASYAITASHALNGGGTGVGFPFSGSAIITGSLQIKSDINNVFLIKNFNNQPILTVSQSGVVVFATQSVELTGSAPNGAIYFTSESFFVGLD